MAKLHFKYGAMNSGKSDTLIKTAYNYDERGLATITVKPALDTKGEDWVVARGGAKRQVDVLAAPGENVRSHIHAVADEKGLRPLHCVLVDESQFLEPSQIDQLFRVAKEDGISVICYGLRADFRTRTFPRTCVTCRKHNPIGIKFQAKDLTHGEQAVIVWIVRHIRCR